MNNNRKSNAPLNARSPLNQGRIDAGVDNIIVKLIDYPDEERMKKSLAKMTGATIGNDINKEVSDELSEELFRGGLQTGLKRYSFIFEISGVSRAFTHQFVRTSEASYHQQSSRFTDMGRFFNVRCPKSIHDDFECFTRFIDDVKRLRKSYEIYISKDIPYEDARFVCPIGLETYIIGEFPISTFLNTYSYRACIMFQWEINFVFKEMKRLVVKKFNWMDKYIKISCEKIQRCTYQGWEDTSVCNFPWSNDRVYKPDLNNILNKKTIIKNKI